MTRNKMKRTEIEIDKECQKFSEMTGSDVIDNMQTGIVFALERKPGYSSTDAEGDTARPAQNKHT